MQDDGKRAALRRASARALGGVSGGLHKITEIGGAGAQASAFALSRGGEKMLETVETALGGAVQKFGDFLMDVLPLSPFAQFYEVWTPPEYLGWLNWFFPVGFCLRVLAAWLGAITLFYLYSIIMRWVKVIGD